LAVLVILKQRRLLAGWPTLNYDLEALRRLVRVIIKAGGCLYCQRVLSVKNFSVDHRQPVIRGGSWELSNLAVCCDTCNCAKGSVTEIEFAKLHDMADRWPEWGRRVFFARLKAGSRILRRKKVE
jgi:5-methylcytosine-specific restriction endonuclease McrA